VRARRRFDSAQDGRPYSLAVLPGIDRVVSTSTDMIADFGAHLQIWRLSDLTLLQTIELPATTKSDGHSHTAMAQVQVEDHHLFSRRTARPRRRAYGAARDVSRAASIV
jgi:hypothetical protein